MCLLKVLKNIEYKFFFVTHGIIFKKTEHFDINALPLRKIKRKWGEKLFEKKFFYIKIFFLKFFDKIFSALKIPFWVDL